VLLIWCEGAAGQVCSAATGSRFSFPPGARSRLLMGNDGPHEARTVISSNDMAIGKDLLLDPPWSPYSFFPPRPLTGRPPEPASFSSIAENAKPFALLAWWDSPPRHVRRLSSTFLAARASSVLRS
jgi:hypothetical protein